MKSERISPWEAGLMLEWFMKTVERAMTNAAQIEQIISGIIQREGVQYTNNPDDAGGPTKFGITLMTLSAWRGHPATDDDIKHLEESEARQIYQARYFSTPQFDQVYSISASVGIALLDAGVNNGVVTATKYLQRVLAVMNQQGRLYPDISVDGFIGFNTLAALRAFLAHRGAEGEKVLLRAIECLHGADYIELAERRPQDETNIYGWISQRVVVV